MNEATKMVQVHVILRRRKGSSVVVKSATADTTFSITATQSH